MNRQLTTQKLRLFIRTAKRVLLGTLMILVVWLGAQRVLENTFSVGMLLAFIAYSVANGFRNRSRASRNLEEYFLAGRTVRGWRAGFSLAATQFAADTPLLVAGLIATGGSSCSGGCGSTAWAS